MSDIEQRARYGDELVDSFIAIRYYRSFQTDGDAFLGTLDGLFWKLFNDVERWSADNDCRRTHEAAWRCHDAFVEGGTLPNMLTAYERLHWLSQQQNAFERS